MKNAMNLSTDGGEPTPAEKTLAEVRRISWIGIWVNLLLTAMKFFAGIVGHSSVLVADAVNSLSDMITDIVVLVGSQFWGQPPDDEHPYGHAKIETMITLFIGIAVFLVGFGLVYGAIQSIVDIIQGEAVLSPTWLPFVIAIVTIVIKCFLYRLTLRVGLRIKSTAVIANAKNHQSDVWASIPAAIAIGLCLLLGNQYAFLDPVGAVVVSVMIMYASWEIIRPTFGILLDGGTSKEQRDKISETILSFPEVRNFEKLRTRLQGPSGLAVDVHVRVDGAMSVLDSHELTRKMTRKLLDENPNILEVTIHIEPAEFPEDR